MGSQPWAVQGSVLKMGDMGDIGAAVAMADHFDKIQKLPDPVVGCPNFRRVPGYKVYCCGQPTKQGFEAALNKVCGDIYPKTGKIIWINMRQEPDIYVNGEPVCARPPNKIGEYAELGNVTRDSAKATEVEFLKVCEQRIAGDGGGGERDPESEQCHRVSEGEVPWFGPHEGSIPADQLKVTQTFVQFMEANSGMRNLIDTGKGDLQWERDIPPAALANLEELAKKDFKGNLGKIIHDIYQTAHTMFGDMPQGDHKERAKYRFASKTLMRLLPKDLCGQVESMIEQKTITLDLYDILGQCTWGQK